MEVPISIIDLNVAGDFVHAGINPTCEKAIDLRNADIVGVTEHYLGVILSNILIRTSVPLPGDE